MNEYDYFFGKFIKQHNTRENEVPVDAHMWKGLNEDGENLTQVVTFYEFICFELALFAKVF